MSSKVLEPGDQCSTKISQEQVKFVASFVNSKDHRIGLKCGSS